MQALYAYFTLEETSINRAEKELQFSIEKSYDLYHYLLLLIKDISIYAHNKIEAAKQKRIPSYDDLHPNTKFIDNKIINQISINSSLNHYLQNKKMSWVNYPELIKSLYNEIKNSECYATYMNNEQRSYKEDKELIITIYQTIIAPSSKLESILEDQSIYWNDDIEFIISMIIRTIQHFKEKDDANCKLMPLYKNEEDSEFTTMLFRKAIFQAQESKELIKKQIKNWDIERLAFVDILLMQMAICELTSFPLIPVKVTMDEYIEIAKYYSTSKSSYFINGILDKIVNNLKNENKIQKKGTGLIDE